MWRSHIKRDALCFLLGATGFLHELVVAEHERPFILTASLALMGFPFVLNGDSRIRLRRNGKNGANSSA